MADPSSRVGFYWCSNGVGEHGNCPHGEFFFQDEQACGFDETTARPGPPGPPTRPPATTRHPVLPTPPANPCKNMPDNVSQLVLLLKTVNYSQLLCSRLLPIHWIVGDTSGVKTAWLIQENATKVKSSSKTNSTVMLKRLLEGQSYPPGHPLQQQLWDLVRLPDHQSQPKEQQPDLNLRQYQLAVLQLEQQREDPFHHVRHQPGNKICRHCALLSYFLLRNQNWLK